MLLIDYFINAREDRTGLVFSRVPEWKTGMLGETLVMKKGNSALLIPLYSLKRKGENKNLIKKKEIFNPSSITN